MYQSSLLETVQKQFLISKEQKVTVGFPTTDRSLFFVALTWPKFLRKTEQNGNFSAN